MSLGQNTLIFVSKSVFNGDNLIFISFVDGILYKTVNAVLLLQSSINY